MNFRIYLIAILSISTMLNAAQAPQAPSMVILASADGQEFRVPLEIAQQSEELKTIIQNSLRMHPTEEIKIDLSMFNISGKLLPELAQLMQALYQYKNLDKEEFFKKFGNVIPIKDDYAFVIAVKSLKFKPGIAFISEKIAQKEDFSFPKTEHDYWMNFIQQINPQTYATLKKCEASNGKPCIEMKIDEDIPSIVPGNEETHGYPILLINPELKLWGEETKKLYLDADLKEYNQTPGAIFAITADERKYILEIIKEFAPVLYQEIVTVDPSGADHIKSHSGGGAAVNSSVKDGLPDILVGYNYLHLPKNELRAALAHELSHYVLGHFKELILTHKALQKVATQEFKKGKKVIGQLPFEESFSSAYSRIKEFEADRFAVIEFGIPIDDAIAWAKDRALAGKEHQLETPQKETFKTTHPLWMARIKQFEELRREVELNKARNKKPAQIDWKKLAANYLQEWKQKYPELYP